MHNQENSEEEVIRLLNWIDKNPMEWESIFEQRGVSSITPLKTMEDCDTLTFSGLYSVMITILFSEATDITRRVIRRIAARAIIQKIEEEGVLDASKEILNLLNEEWERMEHEAKLQ